VQRGVAFDVIIGDLINAAHARSMPVMLLVCVLRLFDAIGGVV